MRLSKKQLALNAAFSLALLGVIIWALYAEYERPWKTYQKEFSKFEYEVNAKKQEGKTGGEKISQIWLPELGVIDRCTTCHLGADRTGFDDLPQPYRTHSGDYLKQHPVEKFGCVICHEGQGPALTAEAAHGHTENWTKPLLSGPYAQSSCVKCHSLSEDMPASSELAGGSAFIKGWGLFRKYNCTGCHKLSGYNRPEAFGPALTSIGNKVSREWLTQWLKDPLSYLPKTKMPRFRLSDNEIEYVADYLMGLSKGTLQRSPTSTGKPNVTLIKEGEALFTSIGCTGCHMINGEGSNFAPDLSDIGGKVSRDWLFVYLQDPQAYDKNSAMPAITADENEIRSITAYLMSLKKTFSSPGEGEGREGTLFLAGREEYPGLEQSILEGEKIVRDQGCTGCHEIGKLPSRQTGPELDNIGNKRTDDLLFPDIPSYEKTLLSWLKLKVAEPAKFNTDTIITKMPDHKLSNSEAEALVTFLAGMKKDKVPAEYARGLFDPERDGTKGRKLIETYNCLGCHKINNIGGNIAPDLTEETKKSRPEWLFGFLKGPHKIRPPQILKANMPDLKLTDEDIRSIIEYLSFIADEPYPYTTVLKKDIPAEDIWDGEKLYREIFACSACHAVNRLGGEIGPDHSDLASRLKRTWIERWLRDPQSIKPDVRMPKFTFKEWEFEALTNYIMTLGQYRFVTIKNNE